MQTMLQRRSEKPRRPKAVQQQSPVPTVKSSRAPLMVAALVAALALALQGCSTTTSETAPSGISDTDARQLAENRYWQTVCQQIPDTPFTINGQSGELRCLSGLRGYRLEAIIDDYNYPVSFSNPSPGVFEIRMRSQAGAPIYTWRDLNYAKNLQKELDAVQAEYGGAQ